MQELDLRADSPNQFEGKIIRVGGKTYRIGKAWKKSANGYNHFLINEDTKLCLHMFQVRLEYRNSPVGALEASRLKLMTTSSAHAAAVKEGESYALMPFRIMESNGGSYEVHEIPWCAFDKTIGCAYNEPTQQAQRLVEEKNYSQARTLVAEVLRKQPDHTEALATYINCLIAEERVQEALQPSTMLLNLEPNYSNYWRIHLLCYLKSAEFEYVLSVLNNYIAQFPHQKEHHIFGIEAALNSGSPETAQSLLSEAAINESTTAKLAIQINSLQEAKDKFVQLDANVSNERRYGAPELLDELQKILLEPPYPLTLANLGLAYFNAGSYKQSAQLLWQVSQHVPKSMFPTCTFMIAFALAELGKWDTALSTLQLAVARLKADNLELKPEDVPGVALWFHQNGAIVERHNPPSSDYFRSLLARIPDRSLVTPEVEALAALYEQFSDALSK